MPGARPGERRIYSNVGYEALAEHIAQRAETPFADSLASGVLQPLGMQAELRGSPAADLHGSLDDLVRVRARAPAPDPRRGGDSGGGDDGAVLRPRGRAAGLRPLRSEPLGPRLRAARRQVTALDRAGKSPRTFGHFGGSGTFLWVDPERGLALGVLTDLEFGDWAKEAWPRLSDAVLDQLG